MFPLPIPAFGEINCVCHQENRSTRVVLIDGAAAENFAAYCALFKKARFSRRQRFISDHRRFAAYEKDGWGVFINYFAATAQLQLVMEENTAYFSYADHGGPAVTSPQLTQVYLSDYGLSDVIRLPDGRLIIIDGGYPFAQDVDHLFDRLQKDAQGEKPVIAAWIFTHPHSDHYFCFFPFMQKYGEAVTIEKFFFNFPESDDLEHYPKLGENSSSFAKWAGRETVSGSEILNQFRRQVEETGIPVYTPHTGQSYQLGEAKIQILASMDDTIHCSKNINTASLMFLMELAGQKIFFGTDGSFAYSRLPERYGRELKSDIMQVPHHGFGCGDDSKQIAGYRLIDPAVCLLPVEKKLAYTSFTTYRESTNYLFTRMPIQEIRTGETDQTLPLPYIPDPAGAYQLQTNYLQGRDDSGARTWVFTELNTGRREDFVFSVVNMTYYKAELSAELYFENTEAQTVCIQIQAPPLRVSRVNCLLPPDADPAAFDGPDALSRLGIPENTDFAVRFTGKLPVVISHREHAPAYRSSLV